MTVTMFDLLVRFLAGWVILIGVQGFSVDGFRDFVLVSDLSVLFTTGR